ncbi:hypothetical protein [Xylophilus sp. GOD-11R]|uniref:hypothetical protein n=1 Tax=Xylophilus sp. GOD-11R TaxID=3089814 RepID=UPI00298C4898|nr:hypothetical protein [Xylophilus sp. GOD-11R]WPB55487.1 hypothetical protein R9X41_15205 [Xylophilus sp. GOD-11R]
MSSKIPFIVVENRENETLTACKLSAKLADESLAVLSSTTVGAAYAALSAAYVHMSSNSPAFELICFRRYFLLQLHLDAHPEIDRFVLIDSDVLLFPGVGTYFERLAALSAFAGSAVIARGWNPRQISPHVSLWSRDSLASFLAYVLQTYTSAEGLAKLRAIEAEFQREGRRGGISDMTLLYLWAEAMGHVRPCNQITRFGVVDHNINISDNHAESEFVMRGGAKKLTYINGQPYLTTVRGDTVKALALHFQGKGKIIMKDALMARQMRVILISYALLMARHVRDRLFILKTITLRPQR